jgi:hypothetical protein
MPKPPAAPDRPFYDVFISYRHRDSRQIDDLEHKIRNAGFEPWRDLNFPAMHDPSDVTREKIETIRRQLSRSTCLIFAYSHASALRDEEAGASLGVWMPWELGFFDGAISSRIGVYLIDGPRNGIEPKVYFKGSEFLQLYDELTDEDLDGFLRRYAVRERRIDNVTSAFIWLEHLSRECAANPTNVSLGVAEWFADRAAHFWEEHGNPALGKAFAQMKVMLDDIRVTAVPALRLPMFDELAATSLISSASEGAPHGTATSSSLPATHAPREAPLPGVDLQAMQRQLLTAWAPLLAAWQEAARTLPAASAANPFKATEGAPFR